MSQSAELLDHPVIVKRAFYPRPTSTPPTLRVDVDGATIGCHVVRVDPDAGWVLYFHGNGELAWESEQYCASLFTNAGWNVCFVEYRGYGTSTGSPSLVGMLGDGEKVVAALGVPPERVVAFGRSLGSIYAIELAHRLPKLAGLVIESGVASIDEQWSFADKAEQMGCDPADLRAAVAEHLDHRVKLAGYTGRLLVLHASGDRLVVPSHAERMYAWGGGSEKKLVMFPRGDHNSILAANSYEYVAEVQGFLRGVRE